MTVSRNEPDDAQAAADALDAEIVALHRGARVDPELQWLANAFDVEPSAALYRRVDAAMARRRARWWLAARLAAVVLGILIVWQGLSILILGQWISRNLGEPYAEHMAIEGAFAFIAAGLAVMASALQRRWLPLGIVAGVPLGFMLGVHGIPEVQVFAWGAVFHISEGVAAIVLLVTFLVAWRYSRADGAQDEM